jgi:hypothetical protein
VVAAGAAEDVVDVTVFTEPDELLKPETRFDAPALNEPWLFLR